MENASKALIMGAEILLGVMIISIGVYLFSVLSKYSAETTAEIEGTQLQQFNAQFTRFYGTVSVNKDGKIVSETIKCTLQDIVGVANLAKMNNIRNELEEETTYSNNTEYIQVDFQNVKNLEKKSQDELIEILKDDGNYGITVEKDEVNDNVAKTKYYKVTKLEYGQNTGKVNYIKFVYDPTLQ